MLKIMNVFDAQLHMLYYFGDNSSALFVVNIASKPRFKVEITPISALTESQLRDIIRDFREDVMAAADCDNIPEEATVFTVETAYGFIQCSFCSSVMTIVGSHDNDAKNNELLFWETINTFKDLSTI